MLNPASIIACSYVKNYWKKTPNSYQKISIGLVVSGIAIAGIIIVAMRIDSPPLLVNILTAILVPLALYFLYNLYNLCKIIYKQHYVKEEKATNEALNIIALGSSTEAVKTVDCYELIDSLPKNIPEFVLESLKKFSLQNPHKAFDLIMCVKQTESIINGLAKDIKDKFYNFIVPTGNIDEKIKLTMSIQSIESLMKKASQSARDEFYEPLMRSVFIDHQRAYNSAIWICKVDKLFNEISHPIKDRFYKYVMNLTLTNHEKAYSLATWIRDNDALLNRVKQCTKSKSYEYILSLSLTDHEKAHDLATFIDEVNDLFNEIRPPIRDKFFDPIIQLAYTNRGDALIIATVVKEIDQIVSCITNKELIDHFDESFTFTEIQSIYERSKVIGFAKKCKKISEKTLGEIQNFINMHTEGTSPEGIIKQAEVVNHLEMVGNRKL
ncbi:hypothetical protein [Wolbachia endosymbiont of Folsomia candida]|uniref:hypothetical protein n=1 Tax=Wolbachia endosymbiont of Folsomia candida TaxID=169402 RepID=UPI000B0F40BC|nr:hypothetical protein [Wolbachia endosymbiont of Folsomia candida]APR98450.1 hypothetical protein ASM33_04205 [Wolbachia endosymbiont of Folsomia candida]